MRNRHILLLTEGQRKTLRESVEEANVNNVDRNPDIFSRQLRLLEQANEQDIDSLKHSLLMVLGAAIDNSCSCVTDEEVNKHDGYLGHDKTCHVNGMRKHLKRMQDFVDGL